MAHEGFVDHLAVEGDGGVATGERVVVGGDQPPGAVDLFGCRREDPVREGDLRRVDAQLPRIAERAPDTRVGNERVLVVERRDRLIGDEHAGEARREYHA